MNRQSKGVVLVLAMAASSAVGAGVYKCVDPVTGKVTFGDKACEVGDTYEIPTPFAPYVGTVDIQSQNAGLLADYEARLARQRNRPAPSYPSYSDRLRDRELRMQQDRIHRQMDRAPNSLGAWSLGLESREIGWQRQELWRPR